MKAMKINGQELKMSNVDRPSYSGSQCYGGNKTCGTGTYQVCVPQTSSCPINYIKLLPNSEAKSYSKKVPLGSSYKLVFKDDGKDLPVVNTKLQIDTPCMESYFF